MKKIIHREMMVGKPEAVRAMALKYACGNDEEGRKLAKDYLYLAAKGGDAKSLFNLGLLHEEGKGVRKSKCRAYMCYELASKKFSAAKTKRDKMERENLIPSKQIRIAKRMAEKCRKQIYEYR